MTDDSTLIERAMRLAARAHLGQTRKESNLPYLMHPSMVALMLARHGFGSEVLAAAPSPQAPLAAKTPGRPAAPARDDSADLWVRTQTGVAPLKRKR